MNAPIPSAAKKRGSYFSLNIPRRFTDKLNMNEKKKELIRRAREAYRDIMPCTAKNDLSDCFTTEGERVFFWFNTADRTTHLMVEEI